MSLGVAAIPELHLADKVWRVNWGLMLVVTLIAGVGFLALYSAGRMNLEPWALKHATRYGAAFVLALAVAMVDIRFWMRLAYPVYLVSLVMLLAVDIVGKGAMGAQRWLVLGPLQIQPSELMKVALVMALARYYHNLAREEVGRIVYVAPPLLAILAPVALVMVQPDLGTALVLLFAGAAVMFAAGVKLWMFIVAVAGAVASLPIGWSLMREYQRNRVLTFLDPDRDPLGAGYHITQSKIAIGSGGLFGKGYGQGTQSALNFLPEKQTDFIFTMWTEENGLLGAVVLLGLFAALLAYGFFIARGSRNHFGRVLAMGITVNIFLYVFINVAMVMGLIPVVGVPLPLVSYGGTAMLTVMFACGLLQGVAIHRDLLIPRNP